MSEWVTLETSRGKSQSPGQHCQMLWQQKKLSGLFYYIIPTLIYKTKEMSKKTEKKQLRKDMEKK